MSIKDSSFFGGNNNAGNSNSNGRQKRDTKGWLNVGSVLTDGRFAALPLGVPLDLDDQKPLRGSPEFVQLMDAGNKILSKTLEKTLNLKPGEEIVYDPRQAATDGAVAFAEGLDEMNIDEDAKDELIKLFQSSVVVMPFAIQLRHAKGEAEAIEQNDMLGNFEL